MSELYKIKYMYILMMTLYMQNNISLVMKTKVVSINALYTSFLCLRTILPFFNLQYFYFVLHSDSFSQTHYKSSRLLIDLILSI